MTKHHQTIVAAIVLFLLGAWFASMQINGGKRKTQSTTQTKESSNGESAPSGESDSTEGSTKESFATSVIPFRFTDSNNISVPVLLNQKHELNLMFHSAIGEISLTTEALAKVSDLKIADSVEVQSWGGNSTSQFSTGNQLKIGDLYFENQTVFIDEFSGPGTDGKFGPELFAGKLIEVDFDNRRLVLHSSLPSRITQENSIYKKIDYTEERGCMYLTGELTIKGNKLAHSFMMHTGFGGTLLLDDQFVSENQLQSSLETISERELKDSFGNIIKTKKVLLPAFELGGTKFNDLAIELFDGAIGRQKVSVMGGEILKRFNMIIDASNRCIYVTPNEFTGTAFNVR